MARSRAAKRLILSAASTLVANKVRPGATDAGGTSGFVSINHNMIVGSFLDGILIVVVNPLAVVVFATRDDVSHISAFHCLVAVCVHKCVCRIHMSLIVAY